MCEPQEIDGKYWNPIKIIKEGLYGAYYGLSDWEYVTPDEDSNTCGYIRMDECGQVIVKFPFYNITDSHPRFMYYTNCFGSTGLDLNYKWYHNYMEELTIYNFGNIGDSVRFGLDSVVETFTINDVMNIENADMPEFPLEVYQCFNPAIGISYRVGVDDYKYSYQFGVYSDTYPENEYSGLFFLPFPNVSMTNTIPSTPKLRYVTDKDNNILYTAEGGLKLWEMEPSAVEGVGVESPAAEAVYYDLQGRRVAEPSAHGAYRRRQGAKAKLILTVEC